MSQDPVKTRIQIIVIAALLFDSSHLVAEDTGLGPIVITPTRVEKNPDEIPAAISIIGQVEIQLGTEQLGLDESLAGVAGLFALNRYNFAQDLRLSIRGFGARSSFGIRGIKIVVDGIPETLPDGQGSVDGIDIGSASQVTVFRSPSSSLYGNASGGAILIESERGPSIPFAEGRATFGDYHLNKHQLKTGGDTGKFNYLLNLSDTTTDGYRDHSKFKNTQLNTRLEAKLSTTSSLLTTIHHTDQPAADDPGGLTAAEAESDPAQARAQNLTFDAGEKLKQTRIGLLYKTSPGENHDWEARIYNTDRDFSNKLPFQNGGIVKLERDFYGAGVKYTLEDNLGDKPNRLLVGIDYDRQDDDRSRFDNLQGVTGAQTFQQNELVTSLGAFLQNETKLSDIAEFTVGIRYDEVKFRVNDQFKTDGDDSGDINFYQVSPMAGISIKRGNSTHLYATISSAFETPTTTEFANPDGGGFNQSLEAQQSINYELGVKTLTDSYRFEAALFHIDVDNELTPFELPAQPGRTFFENAGSSSRNGLELSYTRQLAEQLGFSMAYTHSDFKFDRFTDTSGEVFDGNDTPGIPEHLLYVDFSWFGDSGFFVKWDVTYTGEIYADNANQTSVGSSTVSNLRLGHNVVYDDWELGSFVGVNNLFDEEYNDNIRINAFGGRYFEPAPERNAYIGITLRRFISR
ncbi:MAG: TonB-dependent receptor [Gammaproteobacteria bacterium]|nr:TonB-dependent receptor [Gammaproteobacteria bacterium]